MAPLSNRNAVVFSFTLFAGHKGAITQTVFARKVTGIYRIVEFVDPIGHLRHFFLHLEVLSAALNHFLVYQFQLTLAY